MIRRVTVTLLRPGAQKIRRLAVFTTVRRAERFICMREKRDPVGVSRGDYGIDPSPRAHAEYQCLRRRAS